MYAHGLRSGGGVRLCFSAHAANDTNRSTLCLMTGLQTSAERSYALGPIGFLLFPGHQVAIARPIAYELAAPSNNSRSRANPSPTRSKKARTRAVPLRSAWVTIQSSPLNSATGSGTALVTPASLSPR